MIRSAEYLEISPTDFNQGFSGNRFLHFHPPQEEKTSILRETKGLRMFCIEDRVITVQKNPHSAIQGNSGPVVSSRDIIAAAITIPHSLTIPLSFSKGLEQSSYKLQLILLRTEDDI